MATSSEGAEMSKHTFRIFVKASPDEVWKAITDPATAARYGYGGQLEIEPRAGGAYRVHATEEMKQFGMPDVVVDGEVVEAEAPRRLVQTWQAHFNPEIEKEPVGRVTWETEPAQEMMFPGGGVTLVTLTHELDDAASETAGIVSGKTAEAGGGWALVLSDLKTLLETGSSLAGR